jgi:hypothetical protein
MAELVYAADLKSVADKAWGFESLSAHHEKSQQAGIFYSMAVRILDKSLIAIRWSCW